MRKIKLAKVANGGFTLVELLLVVAILAVLASLAVGVLGEAQNDASIAATRSRITVIQQILEAELEEYEIRRPPISLALINQLVGLTDLDQSNRLVHARNIRRMIVADLIRVELPDGSRVNIDSRNNAFLEGRYVGQFPSDVLLGYLGAIGVENENDARAILNSNGGNTARSRPWGVWRSNSNGWTFDRDSDPTDDEIEDAASRSELLFEILSRIDVDGIPAIEQLSSAAIGDTNGNGFNEVLDAWGEPIFLQWQQEWLFASDLSSGVWERDPRRRLGGLSAEHDRFFDPGAIDETGQPVAFDPSFSEQQAAGHYSKPVLPTQIRPFLTSARLLALIFQHFEFDPMQLKKTNLKQGFTLIEMLVVLGIVVTLVALLVPRIRTINEQRGVREASRVVGSKFATASQRAVIDGVAGVRIERNPNFLVNSGLSEPLQYASTRISLLREVPNYTGDSLNATATVVVPSLDQPVVSIPVPIEQASLQIVRVGDSISLNNSSIRFRIIGLALDAGQLQLTLDASGYIPLPLGSSAPIPFVIHRLPRVLRSSRTDLPGNFIIDLRYSGCLTNATSGGAINVFEYEPTAAGVSFVNSDIDVIFDGSGGVDSVVYRKVFADGTLSSASFIPQGPINLFVVEAPDNPAAELTLADGNALWVNCSNVTGSTNVGNHFPVADGSISPTANDPAALSAVISDVRAGNNTASANQ